LQAILQIFVNARNAKNGDGFCVLIGQVNNPCAFELRNPHVLGNLWALWSCKGVQGNFADFRNQLALIARCMRFAPVLGRVKNFCLKFVFGFFRE
jgi:hypothetical protein